MTSYDRTDVIPAKMVYQIYLDYSMTPILPYKSPGKSDEPEIPNPPLANVRGDGRSGRWLVIGIVSGSILLGLIALRYRPPPVLPATMPSDEDNFIAPTTIPISSVSL
jgi:hypothetical protein